MALKSTAQVGVSTGVVCAYITLAFMACLACYAAFGEDPSSIVTTAAAAQCVGIFFLCMQVLSNQTATGISAKALMLDAFAISCRLSCTLWNEGYLPVSPTGDGLFQSVEICSLLLLVWLLYNVTSKYRDTYQATEDCFQVWPIVAGSFVLACLFHANLCANHVFDTLWMTGLFSGSIAVLPQFGLICNRGGRVEAFTSHYIIALASSRFSNGYIMWLAGDQLKANHEWIRGFMHAKWVIWAAHLVQILLVTDFAYHYVRSAILYGFRHGMVLPTADNKGGEDWSRARWI